jgi:hypothetical protein
MIIGRSDPHRNHRPHIDLGAIDIKNSVSRLHAEIRIDSARIPHRGQRKPQRNEGQRKEAAAKRTSTVAIPGSMRLW